ncbi:hypothetical protein LOAG_00787 [Loa loa]|uniref:NF-kappa-B inhibitor-interacting Ras-like protein n=1 Tax=Loa loa TaxID=7209 RepID=A0A1S0UCH4_LOALO|nr:hypothetical protein LOAG_00787 [Loa loa]EFO27692.1 hypothetical protein LOAG_00787 [Loa loa]
MSQNEAKVTVKSKRGSSNSEESCKCYCQGGKRTSYPYGWTTTTTASVQYDSIGESSSRAEDRSLTIKSGHIEHISHQAAHPVAVRHLGNQTLERKPIDCNSDTSLKRTITRIESTGMSYTNRGPRDGIRSGGVSVQVLSALIGNSGSSTYSRIMGKVMRVLVAGSKRVGKTACLEQLACLNDITDQPYVPTIEDTYQIQMDYGDRSKEIMVFHDTAGISESGPIDLKRSYIQVADAFLLLYSVVDHETFNRMDMLKKVIDKQFGKDKKEVPIVVLGNMIDLPGRKVDSEFARSWAIKEKVKLYEVTAKNRNTLVDLVVYLGNRHFHSQRESKFSLSKKLKAEKSNAAILMDL